MMIDRFGGRRWLGEVSIGGSRGGAPSARPPPPPGSQFFHFDIQNFQNVTASGVDTPHYEVHAPPSTGNPGSATGFVLISFCAIAIVKFS